MSDGRYAALVSAVVETTGCRWPGAEAIHNPTAEVVLASLGDVDLLCYRRNQPIFGMPLLLAGSLRLPLPARSSRQRLSPGDAS